MKAKDIVFVISALCIAIFSALFGKNLVALLFVWLFSFLPVILFYFYQSYKRETFQRKITEQLVEKLHKLATQIEIEDFETAIFEMSDSSELGKEFQVLKNKVKTGCYLPTALEKLSEKMKNRHIATASCILQSMYETGTCDSKILIQLAEKISDEIILEKEKQTSVLIQKYTLYAAVFIVPLILGSIISLVSSLNFSNLLELGFSSSKVEELPNFVYVTLNSILVSAFLGKLENSKAKILLYVLIFVPVSLLLFSFSLQGDFVKLI